MSHSTSIVPLVLWGKTPPSHFISVVKCTYDQRTIISGTVDGQIGLWDLRHTECSGLKIVPRGLIFAHGCAVVDIACAIDLSFEMPNVVTMAENGELCLWDIEDGLCLQMNVIPGNHKRLHSVQMTKASMKEWRLLCHGLYSDIHVLDALTLEILYSLRSKLNPDWISALCLLRPARKQEDTLVALNESSCLKVWTLKANYESKGEAVYEQESKNLDLLRAKSMCSNPFTQRIILVISAGAWNIYDASDFSFLASMPSPNQVTLSGGEFVAADRVLVWDKVGNAYLYKLPSKYLLGAESAEQMSNEKSGRSPVLVCHFANEDEEQFGSVLHFSYGRRGPFYKLLTRGNTKGSISIWKIPDSEQADVLLGRQSDFDTPKVVTDGKMTMGDNINMFLNDEQTCWHIPCTAKMSLTELWDNTSPFGLLDGLETSQTTHIFVTASLYIPSQGKLVCGRTNGSIVVLPAAQFALTQLLKQNIWTKQDSRSFSLLNGHDNKVTALLYPHDENPRYDASHLVSGGADFKVCLWEYLTGVLLHTFLPHGGQVTRLLVTPPDCVGRFASCVCSVAQDHSVALLGLKEQKVAMLASRHTFPVETIRWRPKDDFMVVGCTDGTVYVWQLETGHLDRSVAGSVAYDILESCCEETSAPSAVVREYHKKFKLLHLSSMTQHLPLEFATQTIVKKVKQKISTIQQSVTSHTKLQSVSSQAQQNGGSSLLPPMRVCALKTSSIGPDIHVVLIDPEAVIRQLLSEEAAAASNSGSPVNPKRLPARQSSGQKGVPDKGQGENAAFSCMAYEIAELLLSTVHAWGVDPALDSTCTTKLGLMKPVKPISFGSLTRGRLSLMLPGWYVSGHEDLIAGALESGVNPEEVSVDVGGDTSEGKEPQYNAHWQVSSSLTTQHLVNIVAVTNTLMSMNHASFMTRLMKDKSSDSSAVSSYTVRGDVKAGWSLLAALHCCLLPEMMQGMKYRPPLLHVLARRWQDRCLEIREAAQAIVLAELRRIGTKGRKQLIDAWSPHLPHDVESSDFGFEDLEQYLNTEEDKPVVVTADEERSDIAMVMMTTRKMVSSDLRLRHATAIVMLGVIGAEFQKEADPLNVGRDVKSQPTADSLMDVNTLRNTAKALTSLLLQRSSSKGMSAYSAIRRAAIDLIGRGFGLWEPYVDVSQVLLGLLELCSNPDLKSKSSEADKASILSAAADLHRSARHALTLVATARPAAIITTLAKEIARHVSSTSSMAFNQPSPAAIAVYSHVRHQSSTTYDSASAGVIQNSRGEILRLIEVMIEKSQHEVVSLIVEVVDIVVHCLDLKVVKEKGLPEVFPAICRFRMVSYCSNTRRLAVGSRVGHVALYELRSSRCQLIPAHSSAITCLSFSPDGKVLASYSHVEGRISFWQTSTTLLGMLSSTIKCIQSYLTTDAKKTPDTSTHTQKQMRLVWVNNRNVVLLLGDGTNFKYKI